jgi:hypothetical protein
MASHLDVHLGDFNAAVEVNLQAVAADGCFTAMLNSRDIYYQTYTLHCQNQLVWGAGFAGREAIAVEAAEAILTSTPPALRARYANFVEPLGADIWCAHGGPMQLLPTPAPHEPSGAVIASAASKRD